MRIENVRIRNYRALRDFHLTNLPRLAVFLGANGTGKSTLFDVFAFLKDAVTRNAAVAVARRGGFGELVSRGQQGPIGILTRFRKGSGSLLTYLLRIAVQEGRVLVAREVLRFSRGNGRSPIHLVDFKSGQGSAIADESTCRGTGQVIEDVALVDPSALAIKALGQFKRFRTASELCGLIKSWRVSGAKEVLQHDSKPHPLLVVAEPENHVYPDLLPRIVEEHRNYAMRGGQVFVSTHSPGFVNGASLDEVFWLTKDDGFAEVQRASAYNLIRSLVAERDELGTLWMQNIFEAASTTHQP